MCRPLWHREPSSVLYGHLPVEAKADRDVVVSDWDSSFELCRHTIVSASSFDLSFRLGRTLSWALTRKRFTKWLAVVVWNLTDGEDDNDDTEANCSGNKPGLDVRTHHVQPEASLER